MDPRQVLGNLDEPTLVTYATMRLNDLLKSDPAFNQIVNEVIIRRTGKSGLDPAYSMEPTVLRSGLDVIFEVLALFGKSLNDGAARLGAQPDEPGYL